MSDKYILMIYNAPTPSLPADRSVGSVPLATGTLEQCKEYIVTWLTNEIEGIPGTDIECTEPEVVNGTVHKIKAIVRFDNEAGQWSEQTAFFIHPMPQEIGS
jgi:hypothetical protein